MAFRIRPSEPFLDEFRRVAGEQLLKAINVLEEQPDGPHAAVHAARKRFKRLRALYRLIEPDAKSFRQAENARIRDMARSLSAMRDATALVETVDYLAGLAVSAEEFAALGFASRALVERRDRIAASEMDLPARIEAAITTCNAAIAALDTLDLPEGNARAAKRVARAWRKQGIKARRALDVCREEPAAEAFHDLRKCGQVAWMHLTLLEDLWPTALQARRRETKRLVDELGHEHDLSVLTQAVNERPDLFGDSNTLALLIGAIITRQQAVRAEALALSESVFADDAEREADIVRLLWRKAARQLGS